MSRKKNAQSATSIQAAPMDDQTLRMRNYVITMGLRLLCLVLVFVTMPVGWHTAVFAVGAVFLPYFAVVVVNRSGAAAAAPAQRPEIAIAKPEHSSDDDKDGVIRITETPRDATPEAEA